MIVSEFEGGCLCGKVRFTGNDNQGGGHCYCDDCRRASGTSHCSHMIVAESEFSVSGEMNFFDKSADSGNSVSRGFCPECGSAVFSRNSGMPGLVFVRASSLDDSAVFSPTMIVYASRAPEWSNPMAELPKFAEMPTQSDMPAVEG